MNLDEMQHEIMWDTRKRQKLKRTNRGKNLYNIGSQKQKPYKMDVLLKVDIDLMTMETELIIKTNLPLDDYQYETQHDLETFVSQFKKWAENPRYYSRDFNRNKTIDRYGLKHLRRPLIKYEDIEIRVYPEAQKWLAINGVLNFAQLVKELCHMQKQATPQQKRAIDQYVYLLEQAQQLENFLPKQHSYSRYDYSDNDPTKKIEMNQQHYKKEQKRLQQELKSITQKHRFLPTVNFQN